MSPKKTYVAVYERDGEDDAWNVHIKELDGCQTYGRSLRQAQARIREALGLWLDRDPQTLLIRDELLTSLSAVADSVIGDDQVIEGKTIQRSVLDAGELAPAK